MVDQVKVDSRKNSFICRHCCKKQMVNLLIKIIYESMIYSHREKLTENSDINLSTLKVLKCK